MAVAATIKHGYTSVLHRDWGREIIVIETPHYLGKILHMNAGKKGGLQYHVKKDEAFHLWKGQAIVRYDTGDGILREIGMVAGETYHIPPGAVHQVEAIEDCVFFEVSTPVYDDRVRCEERYGLPSGGGLPTTSAAI